MGITPAKPLRADAERNRLHILQAAAEAFADGGLDVPVAEIARRAGVGPGTLFRRFATKDDLVIAILEQRIQDICALLDTALAHPDPWTGFAECMDAAVTMQVRDRGMLESIGERFFGDPRVRALKEQINPKVEALLERAQNAGVVRRDIEHQDIPVLIQAAARAGCVMPSCEPELSRRYLAIMLDGLRPAAATPLPVCAPDIEELERRARRRAGAEGRRTG
ncbi:MAG: TetR/AcrR family transcriptional regulator [Thermoleophilia bacterium]